MSPSSGTMLFRARFGLRGGEGMIFIDSDLPFEDLFNIAQEIALPWLADGHRNAGCAGAARPANAVNVILGFHPQVIADDMGDPRDVAPAPRDVRRDHHRAPAP